MSATSPLPDLHAMARRCAFAALEAGRAIRDVRKAGVAARHKADRSLVCEADDRAEAIIVAALREAYPTIAIVAEEAYAAGLRHAPAETFFLVDALDGTVGFIEGEDGYTVNIALVSHGQPVMGVVHAPATGATYIGNGAAYQCSAETLADPRRWQALKVRNAPPQGLTALVSQRHGGARCHALLQHLPVAAHLHSSSSLKFCLIAAGDADLYPRFSPTMQWDTAAGQAVLAAAGGAVLDETGAALTYGIRPSMTNPGFVALGDPALVPRLRSLLRATPQD